MKRLEILTERTRLRLIEWSDVASIHALHSLPETDEFNTLGIPKDIEETKTVIAPWIAEQKLDEIKNYTFIIEQMDNENFIGLFGLKIGSEKFRRGEVWYKIHVDSWRKGYATEALEGIIEYGFNRLKLHRIEAGCAVENTGSIKVLVKAGMIREGRGRQVLPLKSGWSDNYVYSILETDERKISHTK